MDGAYTSIKAHEHAPFTMVSIFMVKTFSSFCLRTVTCYGPLWDFHFLFFLWQIVHTFVVWSQMYSNCCMELTRRSLTKRLAGLLIISFSPTKLVEISISVSKIK
jgi:hypothetical protein